MHRLKQVRADHADAILTFERDNRAYFALSISDRGDEFFGRFDDQHRNVLADQEAGTIVFFVLVDEHGAVVGRFNLYDVDDGTAALRPGDGAWAARPHRVNLARERRVAAGADQGRIRADGPADPSELGGKRGTRYVRDLATR